MKHKKYYILIGFIFCVFILVCYVGKQILFYPICLERRKIEKIFIGIEVSSQAKTYSGSITATGEQQIDDIVNTINKIRVFRKEYSIDDLEGESPTVWMLIYDKEGRVMDSIDIYYNILVYKGKFYKITMNEYDDIIQICSKNDSGKRTKE
jgi:hypothetical protein